MGFFLFIFVVVVICLDYSGCSKERPFSSVLKKGDPPLRRGVTSGLSFTGVFWIQGCPWTLVAGAHAFFLCAKPFLGLSCTLNDCIFLSPCPISCGEGGINGLLSTQQGQRVRNGSFIIRMRYYPKIHCYQKCYWEQRRKESREEVLSEEDVKFRFACVEQEVTVDTQVHICRSDLVGWIWSSGQRAEL